MSTLPELILSGYQRPVRRCYIKRKLVDGTYEPNWLRVDNYGNRNRVLGYGSVSIEIDHQPGDIAIFEASELNITFDNQDGHWNSGSDPNSLFYPSYTYLNRKFTKMKIECGYLDIDGTEVGVASIFEGAIDSFSIGEDPVANISVLSLHTILQRFDISDFGFSGNMTISDIITAIMSSSDITQYIPYVLPATNVNLTVQNSEELQSTYWDNIQAFAMASNSVPMLVGNVWSFTPRVPTPSTVWTFNGAGTPNPDMFKILSYDDEGADRVRLYWKASNTGIFVQSSNTDLQKKYLNEPQEVDLGIYSDADKLLSLNSLLTAWETPKPTIEFTTRFMVNQIKPLDRINIRAFGQVSPQNTPRWDSGIRWDDGSVWGGLKGPVNIYGADFMVTRVEKNIQDWYCTIKAEKIT